MNIYRKIYSILFPVLYWKNKLLGKQSGLRVLIYHDLNSQEIPAFERQIEWLKTHYTIISPDEFKEIINKKARINCNKVLITFDDGFYSGYFAAKNILNKHNIKAIFFIISDFIGMGDRIQAKEFISTNIIPGKPINEIPCDSYNLCYDDARLLLSEGHTIGAHTKTHARLSYLRDSNLLEEEIISSADEMEKILGTQINDFAYTFGDINSFSLSALNLSKRRFQYIYTGLRGCNTNFFEPLCICREAVSPSDPNWLLGVFIEGGIDFLYKPMLKKYNHWILSSK